MMDDRAMLPFEGGDQSVRRVWYDGRWFFSVVDVIALLTESAEPRRYWSDLKHRVQDEGFRELYAKCVQLKMQAPDGKVDREHQQVVIPILSGCSWP